MNHYVIQKLRSIGFTVENATELSAIFSDDEQPNSSQTTQTIGKKLLELLKASKEPLTQKQVMQYIDLSQLTINQLRFKQAALVAGRKGKRNEIDKLIEDIKEIDAELEAVHIAKVNALVKASK